MIRRHFVHFSQLTITARMLYTGVLCVLGAGYLAAMVFVFISHAGRDGKPALSEQDIVIAYAGSNSGTKLESALMGPMSKMLQPDENLQIVEWVRKGADKAEFDGKIGPLMTKRCAVCHNNNNPHLPSLESYPEVMKVAEKDTGANIHTLVRVSHIHLFGLTFIFFLIGAIFKHAYFRREWLQAAIIVTPFLCIVADIASWYLTKLNTEFAWVIIGSGALMGASFSVMFFVSIWQMWFSRKVPPQPAAESNV
ncbi:MAG: elongation factor-1 alpha [Nitrosomonadales bacterium]|nr:elongation factor-1 alpha [Nitrosomonadales bacterium]